MNIAILESVIVAEVFAIVILLTALSAFAYFKRRRIMSENGRRVLAENMRGAKFVVLLSIWSFSLYFVGEMASVAGSLPLPPANYHEIHEVAEFLHLTMLLIGFSLGFLILYKMEAGE